MQSKCPKCNESVDPSSATCNVCGRYIGPPNVRLAEESDMVDALDERYEAAKKHASEAGTQIQIEILDEVAERSKAVLAMPTSKFREFVNSDKALYSNYQMQVNAGTRAPMSGEKERMRLATDASLYGINGQKISYAALSITNRGIDHYGPISITLRDVAVADRTTVLEEDSFIFMSRHDALGKRPPVGYLATWYQRHKLVVAKLAAEIKESTQPSDFPDLIVKQATNGSNADFIELHIYGTFNHFAIESVSGTSKKLKGFEKVEIAVIKERLNLLNKPWVER